MDLDAASHRALQGGIGIDERDRHVAPVIAQRAHQLHSRRAGAVDRDARLRSMPIPEHFAHERSADEQIQHQQQSEDRQGVDRDGPAQGEKIDAGAQRGRSDRTEPGDDQRALDAEAENGTVDAEHAERANADRRSEAVQDRRDCQRLAQRGAAQCDRQHQHDGNRSRVSNHRDSDLRGAREPGGPTGTPLHPLHQHRSVPCGVDPVSYLLRATRARPLERALARPTRPYRAFTELFTTRIAGKYRPQPTESAGIEGRVTD